MTPWGTGTRDSPIVLDEDSEDELVTETYDPIYRTPSPRPRTFLSTMQAPRLSEASARSLQQFREGLQQQVLTGKRKREPDSDPINNLKHGNHMAKDSSPLHHPVGPSPTKRESKKQRKLRLKLEREVKAEGVGLAKGKQKAIPNQPLPVTEKHHHHQISHPQVSAFVPLPSQETRQRKRTRHTGKVPSGLAAPAPNPKPTPIVPPQSSSSTWSTTVPVAPMLLLPPKPLFGILPTLTNETTRPGPQFGFSGFPGFPSGSFGATSTMRSPEVPPNALYPSPFLGLCGFGRPPPMPPVVTNPVVHQPTSHMNPLPRKPAALPLPPPATKPNSPDQKTKRQQNPEKPFSLRQDTRPLLLSPISSNLTPTYIPIGKPDFRCTHGIFPILPTVPSSKLPNHPSTSTVDPHKSYYYTPTLGNTLVMENIPANLCDEIWISNWSRSACGVNPIKIIFGPLRALIEYSSSESAVAAWASPKLGVDEFGRNKTESKRLKDFTITLYWWRPDKEGEKKVLKMWRVWKKQVSGEMRKAVTHKLRQLEAESNFDVETAGLNGAAGAGADVGDRNEFEVGTATTIASGTSDIIQTVQQAKDELMAVAGQLGFEGRLNDVVKAGVPEDGICRWEQREVARIERRLRVIKHQHSMAEEDACRREDDEALKSTAFNAREKAEIGGEKRKKRKGSTNENKRPSEGERKTPSTGLSPRPSNPYPQAAAGPSEKSEPTLPRSPAPNIPSFPFVPASTFTTAFSSAPITSYPSPFSLTFSVNSNTSRASSNNDNSQLLFGLDQTRAGAGPSLRSPIASTPTPTTAFALSTPTSVSNSSSALYTKFSLFEKPSTSSIPQTSPTVAAPYQLGTTPSVALSFPRMKTPPAPSQLSNPRKRKLTDPEPTIIDQDSTAKKLRGIDSVKESRTQAQPPAVLSVSGISACLDTPFDPPTAPVTTAAAAPTTALVAKVTMTGSAGSATPRAIAEGKLVEGLRKLGQEMIKQRSPSPLLPSAPASGLGAGAVTPLIVTPTESKMTQLSTSKTGQETLGTARGPVAPSPTASGSSASGTSVPAVAPTRVSPDDMDTSSTSEEDTPTKFATITTTTTTSQTINTNQIITQQRQTQQQTSTLKPRPTRSVPPAVLEALKTIMTKPIEERQQFLDNEFKMTKALMDNLATANKDRKKSIIKIWEEKIRIIDEVTKSIKNGNRVWYSHEVKTWIRMQWPSGLDNAGVLVVSDDED